MPVVTAPDARVQLRSDTLAEIAGVDPLPQGEDFPEDADGLILITPKSHHFLNSQLVNHERLRKAAGGALALLAPADAAAAGIVDGAPVVLTNEHGTLELDASVSDNVLEGTVVVLDNWWHRDVRRGPGVNALTGQTPADLGAAPVFTARSRSARWRRSSRASCEQRVRMRAEVPDRALVAERDGHHVGLHRVADAGHDPGEI